MRELIEIVIAIGSVVFAFGKAWGELKAIRADIARLEAKVEKHNNFDRRIIRLETLIEQRGGQK